MPPYIARPRPCTSSRGAPLPTPAGVPPGTLACVGATANDLRRRVAGWRAAAQREQALRAKAAPLSPDAALTAAFELYDLLPADVPVADATRIREIALARRSWHTLRTRLAPR